MVVDSTPLDGMELGPGGDEDGHQDRDTRHDRGGERQDVEAGSRARRPQLVAEQDAQQDRAGDSQDGQRQQHQATSRAKAHDAQQPQPGVSEHGRSRGGDDGTRTAPAVGAHPRRQ